MLFTPKKSKFKKYQKGIVPNKLQVNSNIYSIKKKSIKLIITSFGSLTVKQFVAVRFLIKKNIKKKGFVFFVAFPQKFVSKKPAEIRMGKGKGSFSHWCADLKIGAILCEIYFRQKFKKKIIRTLKKVQIRIPLKTVIKL